MPAIARAEGNTTASYVSPVRDQSKGVRAFRISNATSSSSPHSAPPSEAFPCSGSCVPASPSVLPPASTTTRSLPARNSHPISNGQAQPQRFKAPSLPANLHRVHCHAANSGRLQALQFCAPTIRRLSRCATWAPSWDDRSARSTARRAAST